MPGMYAFGTPTLILEEPNVLMGRFPLRFYTTPEDNNVRWHLGWPRELVQPLRPLLDCEPYWGEGAWHEDGDFLLWHTSIVVPAEGMPRDKLKREVMWHVRMFNMCLRFLRKGKVASPSTAGFAQKSCS